ncbi:MAG: hypothetical protein Q9216_004328 [Gyalolechia sp. 2 TL-2023]
MTPKPLELCPQWAYILPGVYRFVGALNMMALSQNDSSADSAIVSKPVMDNDISQLWHVIDISRGFGVYLINNGTGKFLAAIEGQPF